MKSFVHAVALALAVSSSAFAQGSPTPVPSPKDVLGHTPGEDFWLASYDDALTYFRALDAASDRVQLVRVGTTTRGLDWHIALISSPQNLAQLDRWKDVSRRLAWVNGVDEPAARELARTGKAIVHIDGGLHSSEAACPQATIVLAHQLAAAHGDPTIDRILDEVVLVLWFAMNPDGQNMVAQWYRQNLGTPYEVADLPWLYQEYIGHDNNRDGYMNNMIESRVVTATTLEWNPQVFYNHHQTAPFPTRIWIPPFAEPISSNVHPLMARWVNVFGTTMAAWLDERGMPGAVHRGKGFDNWYPGFIDNVNSYRNTVAFLTETALFEYATPKFYSVDDFPRDARSLRSEVFYASPWKGGWWHIGDAVDYMVGASMAVLDTAARYREALLFNRWQAGADQIRRFSTEGPFAYVVPAKQRDAVTAAKLVEVLQTNGVEAHRATSAFTANGLRYEAGDVVVRMDQPYAALVQDLFEIQDYPDLRDGAEGAPDLPYDVAGWTLPLQMGVEVHAITKPLDDTTRAGLEKLAAPPWPEGRVTGSGAVFAIDARSNAAFRVLNAAWNAGAKVHRSSDVEAPQWFIESLARDAMERIALETHVTADAIETIPSCTPVKRPRIGLLRPWRASIDEGWTRWTFEQFGFAFTSVLDEDVRAGRLRERFDTIVIPDIDGRSLRNGHAKGTIPGPYAGGIGDEGVEALREFTQAGGVLVVFNDAARFAIEAFELPLTDKVGELKNTDFFCGGSILRTRRAPSIAHPVLHAVPESAGDVAVMFEGSPVFEPTADFDGNVLLEYPKDRPALMSGFLLGEKHLEDGAALVDCAYGDGRVVLFGFRPQWRGQSHGTFKLVFDALLYDASQAPSKDAATSKSSDAEPAAEPKSGSRDGARGRSDKD